MGRQLRFWAKLNARDGTRQGQEEEGLYLIATDNAGPSRPPAPESRRNASHLSYSLRDSLPFATAANSQDSRKKTAGHLGQTLALQSAVRGGARKTSVARSGPGLRGSSPTAGEIRPHGLTSCRGADVWVVTAGMFDRKSPVRTCPVRPGTALARGTKSDTVPASGRRVAGIDARIRYGRSAMSPQAYGPPCQGRYIRDSESHERARNGAKAIRRFPAVLPPQKSRRNQMCLYQRQRPQLA